MGYQNLIDGMTPHIAILDKEGTILFVNRAWKEFADENSSSMVNYGIGLNYFKISVPTWPDEPKIKDETGWVIAQGLSNVINEKLDNFSFEYPCHSRKVQRWFRINISAIPNESPKQYIVSHENISELVKERENHKDTFNKSIKALARTIEYRDPYTAGHQEKVAQLAYEIGKKMNLSKHRLEGLYFGAMVHDIGKILVPAEILAFPGKLSQTQLDLIKVHPEVGYNIVSNMNFPWPIDKIILQHHERMDGSGYPNGLKREDILLEAKIVSVADVIEAITSHRPYRPSLGLITAMNEIKEKSDTYYDADVVQIVEKLYENKSEIFEILTIKPEQIF